ncbi:MAG: PAS domain-containing protein [Ignavibacteriales bacterium]|nr:PAS domain-containing protein [Ignavibacteriales bacterium]
MQPNFLNNTKELNEIKSFTNASSGAILKTNLNGIITYFPSNAEIFFNKSETEILGRFLDEIFPEINKNFFEKIRSQLVSTKSWEDELKIIDKNSEYFVQTKIKLSKSINAIELLFYCDRASLQDHKFKIAKEEEKTFFKETVIKSNEIILQTNPYGTILFANEKFCTQFGYDLDEIRGIHFLDLIEHGFRLENDLTDFASSVHKKSFDLLPLLTKTGKVIDVMPAINISLVGKELKYFTIYLSEINNSEKLKLEIYEDLLNGFANAVVILKYNYIISYNKKI